MTLLDQPARHVGYGAADLRLTAEAGIRAPSLHNSQPWLFRLRDGAVEIRLDPARRLDAADRSGWAARLAGGAAATNARLALAGAGRPAEVRLCPDPADRDLLARLLPGPERPPTEAERELLAAVPRRYSNRKPFWSDPVPAATRVRLIEAARGEAAWLDLLVGTTALTAFSQIAHSADRVLRRDRAYQAELAGWTHTGTTHTGTAHTGAAPDGPAPDGTASNGTGSDGVPADGVPAGAGAPLPEPHDLLPQRLFTDRRREPGHDYEPEPLIGILGVPGDRAVDQVAAGQALQRVLLTATAAGLDTSMISQPIEVPAARDQLRRALGRTGYPQIAIRFGYGTPGSPTPRRDVAEVMNG